MTLNPLKMTPVRSESEAWKLGYRDGRENAHDLSMGRTWNDNDDANESYDRGVNAGQLVARLFGPKLDPRFCADCGADIDGNDPHHPSCSRAES
jgi:hypothetical protein